MTVLDYQHDGSSWDYLYVSQALNPIKPEPTPFFVLRYFLWHAVIVSVVIFKCRHLPCRLWFLPLLTAGVNLVIIWSACRQLGHDDQVMHVNFSFIYGAICFLESCLLWWPNLKIFILYGIELLAFTWLNNHRRGDTGIPLIHDRPQILLEWGIILTHFLIVWHRSPILAEELADGTYEHWNWSRPADSFCMCLCCCPGVKFLQRSSYTPLPLQGDVAPTLLETRGANEAVMKIKSQGDRFDPLLDCP